MGDGEEQRLELVTLVFNLFTLLLIMASLSPDSVAPYGSATLSDG